MPAARELPSMVMFWVHAVPVQLGAVAVAVMLTGIVVAPGVLHERVVGLRNRRGLSTNFLSAGAAAAVSRNTVMAVSEPAQPKGGTTLLIETVRSFTTFTALGSVAKQPLESLRVRS